MSALCVAAAGFGLAAPAHAFEIFGLKLFEDQSEADAEAVIADPQPYSVSVVVNATGELESVVRNASALVADEDEPASGAAGLLAKARGDYRRIVAALYEEGHYGGVVSIRVGANEVMSLPPDVDLPDPVPVTIVVEPGPLFNFNRVDILNQAPPTSDLFDQVDLPSGQGFGVGEVARSSVILKAEGLALEAWRQQGYAKAEIASRDVVADHATNLVDVRITVNPGQKA
ncbi:MAG TPA: outer membrane protein assembly factor, partial [Devosia sp.]